MMAVLGGCLMEEKKYAEAEPLLLEGYGGMKKREAQIPVPDKIHLKKTAERLVQLYDSRNMPEKAKSWRAESR